jgi:hypothetical protein
MGLKKGLSSFKAKINSLKEKKPHIFFLGSY